jgi:prophage regulatory protein
MQTNTQPKIKFSLLRLLEVMEFTGLSRSSIYAAMKTKDFPNSIKIGQRAVAWRSIDLERWINTRAPNTQNSEK